MEYHFDQNQGFSPEGISYEQPLTLNKLPDRQFSETLIFFGGGRGTLF